MRQYLHLFWILGSVVACSGEASSGNEPPGDGQTPTAGTPGASGGAQSGGGGAVNMPSGGAATAGASSGGVATTAGASTGGASGGGVSSGGVAGMSTAGAGGTTTKEIPKFAFPTPVGSDQKLSSTKSVTDFDGKMGRFVGEGDLGSGSGEEGQDAMFSIKAGGSLKNVILGAPAADGVHCEGSCTIENVWWEDVGEDAITLLGGSSSNVYRITGGGARKATDKVIQHNGGGTLYVKNFLVEDFGKLYRSCGNCDDQYARHVEFDTIVANGSKGTLAGINEKYKDSAKFKNIFADILMKICERYDGNNTGAEPNVLGTNADGTYCIYANSDISWH
jgi:pectate lyase